MISSIDHKAYRYLKVISFCLTYFSGLYTFCQDTPVLSPSLGRELKFEPSLEEPYQEHVKKCMELTFQSHSDSSRLSLEETEYLSSCASILDETMDYYSAVTGGCSWYCGGGPYLITASSQLDSIDSIGYAPSNVHDLDYKTAWVEGANGKGIGEVLTYHFKMNSPRITSLMIANGYVKSSAAWSSNGRVKKLKMYVEDTLFAILNLKDSKRLQIFQIDTIGYGWNIPKSINADDIWTMKFEILEVYPGSKFEDIAISEIFFDGIDVHCFPAGTQVTMADRTKKTIEKLKKNDLILSYNEENKKAEAAAIMETSKKIHHNFIEIKLANGNSIISTEDHPYLLASGEWASFDKSKTENAYLFNEIQQLSIGQSLLLNINGHTSSSKVISIDTTKKSQATYTITSLSKNRSFIANDIIVGTEPLR